MARPTKFSDARMGTIARVLRAGGTRRAAYESVGVSHQTFADWLERFPAFLESVTRAESECEAKMAAVVVAAAEGCLTETITVVETPTGKKTTIKRKDAKYAVEWLKRRRKAEWSEKIEQELSTPDGRPLQVQDVTDYAGLDNAELQSRINKAAHSPGSG